MEPGELYVIKHDIFIGGALAFKANETVMLEKIEPNMQRPEYRYVVYSNALRGRFQLSDNDLGESKPAPSEIWAAPPSSMGPSTAASLKQNSRAGRGGSRLSNMVLLAILGVAVLALVGFVVFKLAQGGPGPEVTARAFFDAGQARDISAMLAQMDPVTVSQNPNQKARLESNFGSHSYGVGYAQVLKYEAKVSGDKATVVVTVNSNHIADRESPPNTMVEFSKVELSRINGKWLITNFTLNW